MWQDIRHGLRMLWRTPAFTSLAVFVLALGIGVNTAIFSLVHAVLLRPPAVRAPQELRYVYQRAPRVAGYAYREFLTLRETDLFSAITAVTGETAKIGEGAAARIILGESVSANYFDLLGVPIARGRSFQPAIDEAPGSAPAVVISHALWSREFQADPNVLGQTMTLTRRIVPPEDQSPVYTIVGVAAEGFTGVSSPWTPTDYWVPLVQRAVDYRRPIGSGLPYRAVTLEDAAVGIAIGRVAAGVDDERIHAVITTIGNQARQARFPNPTDITSTYGFIVRDSRRVRLPFDPSGSVVPERLAAGLTMVAGLVLIISVSNLAGMLIARGVSRRTEMAVRLSLGASGWQLTRRLLAEGGFFAVASGLGGLLFAQALLVLFVDQTPSGFGQFDVVPFALDVSLDGTVLLFTAAVCVGVGMLVSLGPARQALRTDLLSGLGNQVAAGTTKRARGRVRHLVLIPQVCLSTALLLVAGVLAKPLLEAERVTPGYAADGVAAVDFYLPLKPSERGVGPAEDFRARRRAFHQRVLETLEAAPGVSSAALALGLPADSLSNMKASVTAREGFPAAPYWWVSTGYVSDDYFETLGIRVTSGRAFDRRDREGRTKVAIIDETLAGWLWPQQNAIGRYIAQHRAEDTRPPDWLEIVGIVNEVQPPVTTGLSNPHIYVPLGQGIEQAQTVLARGQAAPGDLVRIIRQAISDAESTAEMSASGPLTQRIAAILYPRRMAAGILTAAGFIGLILSGAGLYGVISYSVAQRLREIGIRATLGASPISLMGLVLREGGRVTVVGAILGLVVAYFGIRLTSSLVIAIPQLDQVVLMAVPIILGVVVLAACFIPARRASKVDPIVVLRSN